MNSTNYANVFASMGDELMQQRATDMKDIKTRMQKVLLGVESVDIAALPEGSIILATLCAKSAANASVCFILVSSAPLKR